MKKKKYGFFCLFQNGLLLIETFSMLIVLLNSIFDTFTECSSQLNVFILLKRFFAEWETEFSSSTFEFVIEARRVCWIGVIQVLWFTEGFWWYSGWWWGLHGLHVCALRPENMVEHDAAIRKNQTNDIIISQNVQQPRKWKHKFFFLRPIE